MDGSRFRDVTIDGKVCEVRMDANAYLSAIGSGPKPALAKQLWIKWWYVYRRHHPNEQRPTGLVVRIFDFTVAGLATTSERKVVIFRVGFGSCCG